MTDHDRRRRESERSPIRRLSSTGDVTSGWHSTLQTTPNKKIGAFLVEALLGAALFGGIVLVLLWLG